MEESQELSDHIAIMDHGKLIACGTNDELVKLVGQQTRIDLSVSAEPQKISDAWRTIEGVERVTVEDEQITASWMTPTVSCRAVRCGNGFHGSRL
jgi:ABC-2 type transport system ATP-binding protein